jgi:hypothetical protein
MAITIIIIYIYENNANERMLKLKKLIINL